MSKKRGVYFIMNRHSEKCYMGCSDDIYFRIDIHFSMLEDNRHYNKELQHDYNYFGKTIFYSAPIVFIPDKKKALEAEAEYILHCNNKYNVVSPDPGRYA